MYKQYKYFSSFAIGTIAVKVNHFFSITRGLSNTKRLTQTAQSISAAERSHETIKFSYIFESLQFTRKVRMNIQLAVTGRFGVVN